MTAIVFYLASLGTLLSLVMLVPVLMAFGFQEFESGTILLSHVGAWGFVSIAVLLSIYGRNRALSRLDGMVLLIAVWAVFPLIIAFSIAHLLELSYISALFEVLSAFTTNGASIVGNKEVVPHSVVAMLATLQWLGGLASIISVAVILAPSGVGGLREEVHHALGHSLVSSPKRLHKFCRDLMQVYMALSAACFIALLLAGLTPYHSYIMTMTALSSGGIAPGNENIETFAGSGGLIVIALFFLLASTSIYWHRMVGKWQHENLAHHRESYYFLAIWVVLAIAYTGVIYSASGGVAGQNEASIFAEGVFNSASILSTSGLQSREGIFALLPPTLVLTLLFVGGGCFSTSGGIKFYRIGGMLSQSLHELNRLVYPNIVRPAHFGSHLYDITLMKAMWGFFAAAVIVIFVCSVLLAASGLEFQAAFTASLANFVTAGPAYGPEWSGATAQGWPDYFEMTPFAHVVLMFLMLAGRLELIILVAVFNLAFWRER